VDILDQGFLRSIKRKIKKKHIMKLSEFKKMIKETINELMDDEAGQSHTDILSQFNIIQLEKIKAELQRRNEALVARGVAVPEKNKKVMLKLDNAIQMKKQTIAPIKTPTPQPPPADQQS
jgi:hypothetical protein